MGGALSAYRAALDLLTSRTTGASRLGLERTRELLAQLGDPHAGLRTIHVAGTNGKGSVCVTAAALLRSKGLRVGLYTSPHLIDFRERILVDEQQIAEEDVVDFIERWLPHIERTGATFFEATTALALAHFARESVDVAVVETGLGGRLDATNVLVPLASAVTSIGLDHTELLGSTLEEIASEKAGIFKPGVAAVIGESTPGIRAVLARRAAEAGAAPVVMVAETSRVEDVRVDLDGTRFTLHRGRLAMELHTRLVGAPQAWNTATAVALLEAARGDLAPTAEELAQTLPALRLAGRFQREGHLVFDVAHNPDGAAALARTLAEVRLPRPLIAVVAVLRDKDWAGMLRALASEVDGFVFTTAPSAPRERAWDPGAAAASAATHGWRAEIEPDLPRAIELAETIGRTVVVTGSFHTVGDALARLPAAPAAG